MPNADKSMRTLMHNQCTLPPASCLQRELQAGAYATASAAVAASSPADMEHLMQQNKDKLNMLRVCEVTANISGSFLHYDVSATPRKE